MAVKKKSQIGRQRQPADAIAETILVLEAWADRWFKYAMPEHSHKLLAFRQNKTVAPMDLIDELFVFVDDGQLRFKGWQYAETARASGDQDAPSPDMMLVWTFALRDARRAAQLERKGLTTEAWLALIEAERSAGWVLGQDFSNVQSLAKRVRKDLAKRAADSRHERTRATKKQVVDWYAKNCAKYRSINAAAKAAEDLFPIARDTARDYFREYRKGLGAARRP